MEKPLYIIGASARACAESFRRRLAGSAYNIHTCDLFADADLAQIATSHRCDATDYPAGLGHWLAEQPSGYWVYTGGMENYPALIATAGRRHTLLGCNAETVAVCRDPFRFADALRQNGLHHARAIAAMDQPGDWLSKPIASCAGMGIQRCTMSHQLAIVRPSRFRYFQEFISGQSRTGLFVANGESSRLLGITAGITAQDLPGWVARGLAPFLYSGSIGPLRVSPVHREAWRQIGQTLAMTFGLRGVFGVDAIVRENDEIVPLEINPRYTASMELLEYAGNFSVADTHWNACLNDALTCEDSMTNGDRAANCDSGSSQAWCKVILYAPTELRVTAVMSGQMCGDAWENDLGCRLNDIPVGDSVIHAGSPICTLIFHDASLDSTSASTAAEWANRVWQRLVQAAKE